MKLNIPKIKKPLSLEAYDESFKGIELQVWVNPTRDMTNKSLEIQIELAAALSALDAVENKLAKLNKVARKKKVEELQERFDSALKVQREWWARILSQSKDTSTHWTADELEKLDEEDTALWTYIIKMAAEMIRSHRDGSKKG